MTCSRHLRDISLHHYTTEDNKISSISHDAAVMLGMCCHIMVICSPHEVITLLCGLMHWHRLVVATVSPRVTM